MDNSNPRHSPKIEKLLNERPRKLQIVGIIMLCVVPLVVIAILSITGGSANQDKSLLFSLLRLLFD